MDIAITVIAHVPDERAEAPTILPEDVTNGLVEYLGGQGVVVNQVDVNFPDEGLVVYCFCGHEPSSHRWHNGQPEPWCFACEDERGEDADDHGTDPAHKFQEAS